MQKIVVIDGTDLPNPEHQAMLAALYSRSPTSVTNHMEQVRLKGADAFMSKWYCGYGHKSIGDCGTTSIFVENVSMIAAKAIQDNALYNGQEASTRYLDFSEQGCVDPVGTKESAGIQQSWIALYKDVLETLIPHFEQRFPYEEGQKKSVWRKAVKARAFDVARGFLPAGARTYVAWHTNLRQAADHLKQMCHNPCREIRDIASAVHEELLKTYPSSFGHKIYEDQEAYLAKSVGTFAFVDGPYTEFTYKSSLDLEGLSQHQTLLETRPIKTELHPRFRQYGTIQFHFPLDFGSFRDIQRHRSCIQDMPLVTTKHGFLPWYLEQLPDALAAHVLDVASDLDERIRYLDTTPEERQYYVAMGYASPNRITCSLPSAIYIAELRSGTTVHPTVRKVAQQMGEALREAVPGIAMHHDMSEGVWDIKRGEQDIIHRGDR